MANRKRYGMDAMVEPWHDDNWKKPQARPLAAVGG
jgi:hypothetical protein